MIEGSIELRTRRGEEPGMEVLRAHEELVRGALGRHEGREEKLLGDGFVVSFSPARHALGCAVAILRAKIARAAHAKIVVSSRAGDALS